MESVDFDEFGFSKLNIKEFPTIGYVIEKTVQVEEDLFFCWGTANSVVSGKPNKFACFYDKDGNVHSPFENAPALIQPGIVEFYHHGTLILEKEIDLTNDQCWSDGEDSDWNGFEE